MRLILMTVLCASVLAGCKKDDSKAGALNVTIGYSGFTKGCVTVTATDEANAANTSRLDVPIPGNKPDTVSVAVFRKKDWGRVLSVTTQLHEVDCSGPTVGVPQEEKAEVPEEGTLDVTFSVRAVDGDGDGYFSSDGPGGAIKGSDCNDGDITVHPAAKEVCNEKDDNCTLGESDADEKPTWYMDGDGDGYGDVAVQVCAQPAGAVALGGDCNDANPQIRPGRAELFCDDKDDNCDGNKDEGFGLESDCEAELKCAGKVRCASTASQTACVRVEEPVIWYVDSDGDGFGGQAVPGAACESPVDGGVSPSQDCDESSRYVRNGLPEVCDRLDNNCSGMVDEECAPLTWTTNTSVGGSDNLKAIALYDNGQKGWLAGTDNLVHYDFATGTPTSYTDPSCLGNWTAAWASANGRLFAVADSGKMITRLFNNDPLCFAVTAPGSAPLHGVTGIEQSGGNPTAYAVSSNGKIFKWTDPYGEGGALSNFGNVGDNLRAIGSAGSQGTLFAVGGNGGNKAVAYRYDAAASQWVSDSLGGNFDGYLYGVHVTDSRFAYAAGANGLVFKKSGGSWASLPPVFEANGTTKAGIRDILAFSEKGIYVATTEGRIHFYDGSVWTPVHLGTTPLYSLDGPSPTRVVAAGEGGTVVSFTAP
ncbi:MULTISPECIES: putative metal-binding motif-containing protein [unclassified Corallococcus]|uniref:putative metal-binding motif-containing protein n=1 Tax=unclassified Corallococcus TaxID=2685029 RepID=UPI001A8D8B4B|nr:MULTISPECIES: putative metal-binding motif-containing protein [unclassified Corallococcus]MBN9682723.1 putative metal-binding motif-containing protein [Corallococcus sp. NCSPR001]WAS85736.1 putative metal-binding motif-containing protein [Corallococcus sp. NCRR]